VNQSFINDLTTGNVNRQLVAFTIPFMLVNLLQITYNLVDMIIVGQAMGSVGLAAVSNGGELLNFFTMLGMSFANSAQIIIAQYVGAGDRENLRKTIGTVFTFTTALAVVAMFVCYSCAATFLNWLNMPPEAFEEALNYLLVGSFGAVFIFGYNTVCSVLRGMGDSKRPLYFVAIATVVNVILDLVFIIGLGWGAAGAALATVIGQGVAFLWSLGFLYRNRERFGFDFKPRSFIPTRHIFGLLIRLGLPFLVQSCAIHVSMLYVNALINVFGVAASAISGVGNKLTSLAVVVSGALSMSGSTMIGQNLGAGKHDRVSAVVNFSFVIGLVFSLALCLVIWLFPVQVFRIWTQDQAVLDMVPMYVPIALLNLIGFAFRSPMIALINGMGYASLSFLCGMLDGVVLRIGLAMLLGIVFDMGILGYWYGSALAGFTHITIVFPYFVSGRWKHRKILIESGT